MSFQVKINSRNFTLWESISVARSIDRNSGIFKLTNSTLNQLSGLKIYAGDRIEIFVGGDSKILGYIDSVQADFSKDSHSVIISGRDNIQDLIDSSVPDGAKVKSGEISLEGLCRRVIEELGTSIPVYNTVTGVEPFTSKDLEAAESGSNCMEYLVSFARKRQVYLIPDGNGSLLIWRPDEKIQPTSILNVDGGNYNNVISYTLSIAQQHQYHKYLCRSQSNPATFSWEPEKIDIKKIAYDLTIRESRFLEIAAEQSMTESECKKRADEESNIRRSKGFEYKPIIQGVTQPNGTPWDIGQLVNVNDTSAQINGLLLIKSVQYSSNTKDGTLTRLTMTLPDAYQVVAEQSDAYRKMINIGPLPVQYWKYIRPIEFWELYKK